MAPLATYRLATLADLPAIGKANWAWLEEQAAAGGPLLPTPRSQRVHMDLVEAYLQGEREGLVVMAESGPRQVGVALAGEPWSAGGYDTQFGKTATIWLVWVHPDWRKSGVGLGMLQWGRPIVLSRGFKTAVCTTLHMGTGGAQLARAFGIHPIETVYAMPLKESQDG